MALEVKVVVVEPRYQINLGYIARISKNFGIRKLFFVKPRTKLNGSTAIMYAKHAKELLLNAKIYRNFNDAIRDCDITIGTTGIWRKSGGAFKRIYLIEDAIKRISRIRGMKRIGLIIGRDDIGLKTDEVERCDMIAYIGSDSDYPILNISHALGIMLYLFTRKRFGFAYKELSNRELDKKELGFLFRVFDRITEKKRIRDKKTVREIFRRLVYLSQPNKQEVHALITALK